MRRVDDESLDIAYLSEEERANLENAQIVIERGMKEALGQTIGAEPLTPAIIERAKSFYRRLGRELGARDVEFSLSGDNQELVITFLDVPPMKRLAYGLRLDELHAEEAKDE